MKSIQSKTNDQPNIINIENLAKNLSQTGPSFYREKDGWIRSFWNKQTHQRWQIFKWEFLRNSAGNHEKAMEFGFFPLIEKLGFCSWNTTSVWDCTFKADKSPEQSATCSHASVISDTAQDQYSVPVLVM